jgi:hypothetical protein
MQEDVKHSLSKSLFWDVNFEDLDSQAHSLFITERVLTRGTLVDFKVLKNYFGIEKLKANKIDPLTFKPLAKWEL